MRVLQNTETILRNSEQARNSDKKLLLNYWWGEGLHLSEEQMGIFLNCTPAESITRARRALKEKYPPSKEVDEMRYSKFKQYNNGEIE